MDPKDISKTYSNGEVTVVWKPAACIHSTICWKGATGLGDVFNPRERPWIKMEGADTERIVQQVDKCPSGALTYYFNREGQEEVAVESRVEVVRNGPLLVYGNLTVKDQNGVESKKNKVAAFCRCGLSANKPYCDGAHIQHQLDGE